MQFEHLMVDGLKLRIARSVRPGRPTILMTNAFPQSIRCWESLWDRLAERFDLVAVDMPGFGLSEGRVERMRPSLQAEALVGVMDALGIERAFVVGPDVGVPVALWLAIHHPERLSGINIYDGPGTWPTDFDPVLGSAVHSGLVRWLGVRFPMKSRLMAQNFGAATRAGYDHFSPSDEAVAEYRQICFDEDKHRFAFAYLGSYGDELPQIQHRLSSIDVPTLITWGGKDPFVRPSNAQALHAEIPGSQLTVFEGAGHFSHEDADQAWLDRLAAFIE